MDDQDSKPDPFEELETRESRMPAPYHIISIVFRDYNGRHPLEAR